MADISKLRKYLEGLGLKQAKVDKAVELAQKATESDGRSLDTIQAQIAAHKDLVGIMSDEFDLAIKRAEKEALIHQQKVKDAQDALEMAKLIDSTTAKELKDLELIVKQEKNRQAILEERPELMDRVGDRVEAATGVSSSWKKSLWGSLLTDAAGTMNAVGKKLNMMDMLGSTISKSIEATIALAVAQDASLVAFNKSTGASKKYGDELIQLEAEMFTFGVSVEGAGEAMGSLVKNVYTLEGMSRSTRADVAQTTALLDAMGVSSTTSAQNINFLTTAMGKSGEQAAAIQRDMFATAQAIGRPPAEMSEAFQASSKTLAKFGKQSDAVFKKLYINASKAGMAVDQVLNITEKFDTFAGAAEQVGKLNAMLGGPFLNSMEMVTTTDPTERMKMLSDAVNQAGVSFDDMGYYQRQALAESMGLADVSELALVMAGEFDNMGGSANQSQAELVELAKQSQDFTTIMDEMKEVGRMLAIQIQPLVKLFKTMMVGIQKLNALGPVFSSVLMGIAIAMLFLKLKTLELNWAFMSGPGAFLGVLGMAIMLFINGGTAVKVFAVGLGILTAAIWLFNGALAASGIGAILQIIGFVIVAVIALITWLFTKDVGASTFLEGLVKIAHAFHDIGAGMLMAVSSLYLLMPALLGLILMTGPLAMSVLPGGAFWSLSTGLGWIADSMERMDTAKIGALTTLFAALAEVTREAAENIALMGAGLAMMAGAFTVMSVNPIAMAMAPAIVGGATGTAKAMGAKPGGSRGKPEKLLPLTIKVELEGRKLGEFIKEVVVKELNYNQG